MSQNKDISKPIWVSLRSCEVPEFVEKKNSEWVMFGKKNNYPDELVDLYDKSATHSAIIKGKAHYISGQGLEVDRAKIESVAQQAKIQKIIKYANPVEGLEDVVHKITLDLEVFNIVALEVIWKPNGTFDLYHVDAGKIRVSVDGNRYAYSPDWTKYNKGTEKDIENGFKTFDKFDPNNKKGSQLYYHVQHTVGKKHYTLPEYAGAITYIKADYKVADFHLNYLENGFQAGNLIVFDGQYPGDETASEIERDFAKKFQGTDAKQAGGIMLMWQQEGEAGVKVETLMPNDFDKQFLQLKDQIRSTIFTGHRVVSPNLFGVETDQSFGNRTEVVEKMEIFQSTYVDARQRVIERIIYDLYDTDAITLARVKPISEQFSEQALLQIMTPSELREKAGLEKLDEEAAANGVAEKLATVSPLVATKILDNMSVEEIRAIIGLTGSNVTRTTTTTISEGLMSSQNDEEEKTLLLLSKFGRDGKDVKCKYSKELSFDNDEVNIDEAAFRMSFEVTDFDKQVLGILKNAPTTPLEDIAKALNAEENSVIESVKRLVDEGLLEVSEIDIPDEIPSDTEEVERKPTPEGEDEAIEPNFEVVYRYVLRAGAGVAKTGSRPFCKRLMELGRVYTKDEIDQISLLVGRNVWLRRGGFWNRGKGDISPSCRHVWRQELVQTR